MKKTIFNRPSVILIFFVVLAGLVLGTAALKSHLHLIHGTQGDSIVLQEDVEKKKIALTFDDGPDATYTPMLLDGLNERSVKATFFLLGKQVEQYPEIVKRIFAEGHTIGCHSYEHVNFNQISEKAACDQIQSTCDLLEELTGVFPSFVRPPYGAWPSCLEKDFCMVPVLWDVDPLDWSVDDAALITSRVLRKTGEFDIILLHDASESSVQAAFQIIDTLEKENYEFVTVEELIMP